MTLPRDHEFAASIVRHLGQQPTSCREIVGLGEVNHVFVVETKSGERWVARFCRDPLDTDKYAQEAWCLQSAARHDLPVPALIAVGEMEGIRFIVQSFVEGENADKRRSPELWRTLGRYACIVNHLPLDGSAPDSLFGRFGRDPRTSWLAHVDYNLNQLGPDDPLIGLEVYTSAQQGMLSACFRGLRESVDRFGLTHGDLVPKNVLLSHGGPPTMLDWGSASVVPIPFHDYLRIWDDEADEGFSMSDMEAFAEGYGTPLEEVRPIAMDLKLLGCVDLVRWAIDRRPDRLAKVVERARLAVAQRRDFESP